MKHKRIALVTTWFPPENGVAVNRMKAFSHYLGQTFEVEVFTLGKDDGIKDTSFGKIHYVSKASFLDRIKHTTSDGPIKHKIKTLLNIIAAKFKVSGLKSWKKEVLHLIKNRHSENAFDVVISSYAPVEPHDIAFTLKKSNPKLIWIADMRDEMSSNPFASNSIKKELRKKELQYEGFIDAITTVSKPILDDFKKVMPNVQHFAEIRNGFDHEFVPLSNFNEEFTMAYAGTFYGKRKPDNFFKALENCLSKGLISENYKILFIGTNKNFTIPKSIQDRVVFVPKTDYENVIKMIANVDCNLLINPPLGTKGQFSGKIFDYISVEKPILATVDVEDVAADLIKEHNAGEVADFDDVSAIESGLTKIYTFWKRGEEYPIDKEKTSTLHRKNQIEKLENLILKLVDK